MADNNPQNNSNQARKKAPSLITTITRGILADQQLRRKAMGAIILAAAAMLMAGATFAADWLYQRPFLFIIYWLICGWLTLTAILLALFDMLMVRKEGHAARNRLKKDIFGKDEE